MGTYLIRGVLHNQKGQISVMIAMMLMTFVLFFAFVINTGMLVNAKINLQNAADLAAYAGASVQARQLNHISYLNYEMRRQYKKFLFRYYVIGNMAQATAKQSRGARKWAPNDRDAADYNVPAVCIIFRNIDNYCQVGKLAAIEIPRENYLDQINSTLRSELQKIEQSRVDNCRQIGSTNVQTLLLWLWNTDPNIQTLSANNPIIQRIGGIGNGLGLVPKELILKQRIDTLQYYLNFEAQSGVTKELANSLASSIDPARRERTIQAFNSAFHTLGNHTFPAGDIIMDELLAPGTDGASVVSLKPVKLEKFDTYAVDLFPNGNLANEPVRNVGQDCNPSLINFTVEGLPIGVYKDPTILTYYAIRLQAKAKVMFSPFGDMKLKAYSAAQPFGSRIGPRFNDKSAVNSEFLSQREPNKDFAKKCGLVQGVTACQHVPNIAMSDKDSGNNGWNNSELLSAMQGLLPEAQAVSGAALESTYPKAMAPNPNEAGRYNIINDLGVDHDKGTGGDPFQHFFDQPGGQYAFWAPIFPPDKTGTGKPEDLIMEMIEDYIDIKDSNAGESETQLIDALKDGMSKYIGALRQGKGEYGESFSIARLQDPFFVQTASGQAGPTAINAKFSLTDPKKIRTSWTTENDSTITKEGRTGYSVKFVSFKALTEPGSTTTDGQSTWSNIFPISDDLGAELQLLKH